MAHRLSTLAATDAYVAALVGLMSAAVSTVLIDSAARAAGRTLSALSAGVVVATQSRAYQRHRDAAAMAYRMV